MPGGVPRFIEGSYKATKSLCLQYWGGLNTDVIKFQNRYLMTPNRRLLMHLIHALWMSFNHLWIVPGGLWVHITLNWQEKWQHWPSANKKAIDWFLKLQWCTLTPYLTLKMSLDDPKSLWILPKIVGHLNYLWENYKRHVFWRFLTLWVQTWSQIAKKISGSWYIKIAVFVCLPL